MLSSKDSGSSSRDGGTLVRLAELVGALSLAIDLGTGQPSEHGFRSCILALRFGEELGLHEDELADVYYLALLRHVGCTADAHVGAAVFGDEIASYRWFAAADYSDPEQVFRILRLHVGEGEPPHRREQVVANALATAPAKLAEAIPAHCEVGERLAAQFGLWRTVQLGVSQVFERWDGKGMPLGLQGEAIVRALRVVLLAQDAEVFYHLGGVAGAVAMARQRAGGAHDPWMVERFCARAPALLATLDEALDWADLLAAEPGTRPRLASAQLDQALAAIGDFADLKAPYFSGHSRGVAELAAAAAEQCRLSATDSRDVRRAGWIHDLGQVGISSRIWMRRGRLSIGEWERVRLHTYYTERVASRAAALAPAATLAGLHHERLDSSGYHRGVVASGLSPGSRILAAAETYRSLIEPRPYRPSHSAEAAAEILRQDVRAGRLDGQAVQAVLAVAGHAVRPSRRAWPAGLSEREVEVLRVVARGASNRQIAVRLSISKETVNNHIRHIYDKVGCSTRAAATLFAMQHGLLQIVDQPAK